MCGRYSSALGAGDITRQIGRPLGARITEDAGKPSYNIAPTEEVLAIVAPEGVPEARMVRWGLVPPSAGQIDGRPHINARLEGVKRTGTFLDVPADPAHRALLVASEFGEWVKAEAKRKVKPAPFGFSVDRGEAFCFAGLCAVNDHVKATPIMSATILTCPPNELVRPIHNRMPVILADLEQWLTWINPTVSAEDALSICGPLPADRMTVKPLPIAFNDWRNKSRELLEAPTSESARQLSLSPTLPAGG